MTKNYIYPMKICLSEYQLQYVFTTNIYIWKCMLKKCQQIFPIHISKLFLSHLSNSGDLLLWVVVRH